MHKSFDEGCRELAVLVGDGDLVGTFVVSGGPRVIPLEVGGDCSPDYTKGLHDAELLIARWIDFALYKLKLLYFRHDSCTDGNASEQNCAGF